MTKYNNNVFGDFLHLLLLFNQLNRFQYLVQKVGRHFHNGGDLDVFILAELCNFAKQIRHIFTRGILCGKFAKCVVIVIRIHIHDVLHGCQELDHLGLEHLVKMRTVILAKAHQYSCVNLGKHLVGNANRVNGVKHLLHFVSEFTVVAEINGLADFVYLLNEQGNIFLAIGILDFVQSHADIVDVCLGIVNLRKNGRLEYGPLPAIRGFLGFLYVRSRSFGFFDCAVTTVAVALY